MEARHLALYEGDRPGEAATHGEWREGLVLLGDKAKSFADFKIVSSVGPEKERKPSLLPGAMRTRA